MHKALLVSLLSIVSFFTVSTRAEVSDMSFSIGYMHTKMDNADSAYAFFGQEASTDLDGVNIKFGFESDETRLGIITSLSYSGKTTEYKYRDSGTNRRYTEKFEQSYVSLLIGPSLKATGWLTPYALAGIAFNTNRYRYDSHRWGYYDDEDDTKTAFAFGGGLQIHPFKLNDGLFLVDLSYERALFKDNTTNSFVIGVGYRF